MSDEEDDNVEQAVRRLLRASVDFTQAYAAWSGAPRRQEPERRDDMEDAERRMDHAKQEVVFAQKK